MIDVPKNKSCTIVKQALSFKAPDRLPVFDGFWGKMWANGSWQKAAGLTNPLEMEGQFCGDVESYYWVDLKIPCAEESFFPSKIGQVKRDGRDIFINDGWGRILKTKEDAYFSEPVSRILNQKSDLDKIVFEPAGLDCRYESLCSEVVYHKQRGRAVFVKMGGVFIRSTFIRGEVEFLIDMMEDASFARLLIERVADHLLQVGLESLKRTDTHEYGVWIYDDMCSINGPMFSPNTFEKLFLPVYKKIVAALKSAGARWVVMHSDGNQVPLLDSLIEAGFDAVNPCEPSEGMDVCELIKKYFGKLSFIGGLCNTQILPEGNPAKIRAHIERLVDAGRNGGLIVGGSIGPDMPIESYELYRSIVAQQGAYKNSSVVEAR